MAEDISEEIEEVTTMASTDEEDAPSKPMGLILVLASVAIMAVLSILLIINGGAYDKAITEYFQMLGRQNAGLKSLSEFLSGDPIDGDDLQEGNIGQIFSYIIFVVAGIIVLLYLIPSTKAKVRPYVKYAGLVAIVGLFGSFGLARLLKWLMARPRPGDIGDTIEGVIVTFQPIFISQFSPAEWSLSSGSFVSGHTAQAAALFCLPFCWNRKKWKPVMILAAIGSSAYVVMMGMARMVVGAHWFGDVLWGGYIVLILTWITYKYILFIPEQEQWDEDAKILQPYNRAYLDVLRARDLLEGNEPRRIPYKKVMVEIEGAQPDEKGKIPKEEKMEPQEEIPTDPRVLLQEALDLYAEARLRAEDDPEKFKRQLTNIENWEPRVKKLLDKYDEMDAGNLPKAQYMSEWTYVI